MPEINYVWDPIEDNIVRGYDEAGVVTAEYTTEPDLYGNVISQRRQGEYRQFHYDALGSALAATDEIQDVTDTFAYTAFGKVTERTGVTEIPFQYIGQKGYCRDGASSHYVVRRRVYPASTARWGARDPLDIGFEEMNPYMYVANRPLVLIDPSGLFTVKRDGTAVFGPKINPTVIQRNGGGGQWLFIWDKPGDGASFAQKVTVDGIFLVFLKCCDECDVHSVHWREQYIEVFTLTPRGQFRDNHQASPVKPALYLQDQLNREFVAKDGQLRLAKLHRLANKGDTDRCTVRSWKFQVSASFDLVNGTYGDERPRQTRTSRNQFELSAQLCNSSDPKLEPNTTFNKYLWPGPTPQIVERFPPPTVVGRLTSTDKWSAFWEEGMAEPDASYETTGYK